MPLTELCNNGEKQDLKLVAVDIYKVFKGASELEHEKLLKVKRTFEERGEIRLREHERIIFSTGVVYKPQSDIKLEIQLNEDLIIEKGLIPFVVHVNSGIEDEIKIAIVATHPHLSVIKKFERLATLYFQRSEKEFFKLTY